MNVTVRKDGNVEVKNSVLATLYEKAFVCDGCGAVGQNLAEFDYMSEDISLCATCLRDLADIVDKWREPTK